jgi:CheY-like chemotaxis protein
MSIDRRVLIADDDSEVRLGAVELLAGIGLEVLEAENGEAALAIFSAQSLHLALLDFHMPDRNGLEVFQAMREVEPELPCIFWSGQASEAIESTALRRGASAFLHKPVQPDLLRGEVLRVLELRWGKPN